MALAPRPTASLPCNVLDLDLTYRAVRHQIAYTSAHQAPTDDLNPLVDWLDAHA